jgi:hypothetical protein
MTRSKRLEELQKSIDEGRYVCPVEKIADKLLEKNANLEPEIEKVENSSKVFQKSADKLSMEVANGRARNKRSN